MSSTDHLSELESLQLQVADLARSLAERDHSMQDLREQSQLLRAIVEGTAAETGDEFFASLVTHLTSTLHVQYAVIGEVLEGRLRKIRTLAVSAGGALVDNFEYELAHTPCATALTQTFACFDRNVQATFPRFQRLADLGAESYCAVPLRTKSGAVIGLLVVMDTKPLQHSDYLQSLLGVFAPRIAAEFERRRAEQERAQALADLHNVMETVPDIMFTLDRQGNMVRWNRRVEEVTGYSPEELLDKPALAFVPPEEQARTSAAIQRAFMEGYAELEGLLLTKDHRTIPYHWTGAALKDPDGRIIGITGIGRDVSEKKRAERELQRQRRHLVDAQALAHLGSWDWDLDTGEVEWSDEQFRIFGHEPGAIAVTYDTFLTSLHPDDNDRALEAINDALLGKRPTDVECRIVRPDGKVRFIHVRGDVHWDATGHPLSMAGTVLDITERKQTEEALRASEERWQLAVHGSNDGIWDWNIQTGAIFFSARWKAMRGFEDHDIMNHVDEWRSRIHPDDLDRVLQRIDAYLAKQIPEFCEEYRVQRKDGSYMWVLDRGMALWADDGTPLRMAGSETDITERKEMEQQRVEQQNRLRLAMEIADLAIWDWDIQSNQVVWSDNCERVKRLPPGTFDGTFAAYQQLVHPEDRPRLLSDIERAINGQAAYHTEHRIVPPNGEVQWVEGSGSVYRDEQGRPIRMLGTVLNITGRKKSEEALRESEERFALAVAGSSDILWDASRLPGEPWYAPQTPVWWSPRVRVLLGLEESESFETFEQWAVRLHPDDKDRVIGQLAAHIEHRVPYDSEYRLRTNRGDYRWIHGRGHALWDDRGEPRRMSGSCQDITERKQTEEALVQSERQLRTVLDALPVGVWFTDRSGKSLLANPAAKQIWSNLKQIGLQTPDNQSSWWETIGPTNEPHRWALSRVLTTGVPSLGETFDLECLDGTKKVIRNSTVSVQNEAGVILGAIVLNEDITMLRQAQAALQLTQFSVDHAVEGFFWIGPDAGIFHVNDSACRMLEYTWEELTTMTLHDIDPNISSEAWPAHWEELKEKGSLTFESKYWSRTGRVLDMEVTVNYLQYEGREYNCAIMRDITERKQADAALRASEERYRVLYDETPTMYFTLAPDGMVRSVNRFGAEQLGYQVEELIGHSVLGLFHEQDRETVVASLSECLATPETSRNWEFREVRKDGTIIWMRETARVGQSSTGETVVLVTCEDISERKRAEEELRKSHAFLRQVIDIDPNFIFAKDRAGRFTLGNKAVADVYGTTVDDLIGKTDADFNPNQEEVAFFRQKGLAVLDTLQELFLPEEVITDSTGRTRWLQTVKRPILDEQGRAIMVLGAATDITERKRIEEVLRQREQDLHAAIEERERISQDLHDGILQSLFAVGLTLEVSKSMLSPRTRKTAGVSLDQAIDRLNLVMREVRNFIAGLGSDPLQGKDLPKALQQMLASLTENQATRVRLAVEDRAAQAVSAKQALHLFLVIQEAVSNCIQHGRAKKARVSLKMLKQGVRLSIRDNGRGFNLAAAKGTGHGLGNMAARAQKMGGRFTILSKVNEGTSIVLDLPKAAADVGR